MNHFIKITLIILLVMLSGTVSVTAAFQEDPVQPGATLEKLAGDFLFTEGPSPDAEGNVYFTDQPNNRIMKWTTEEKLITFMQPCGRSNGLFIDRKGFIWACADEKNELWRISPDKSVKVIIGKYEEQPLNGPNDLWITKKGGIYFTDPYYQRSWWDHKSMLQKDQSVYFLKGDLRTLVKVASDLKKPNGITGTPDNKTLYVSDIGDKKTWSFTINKDGSLSNKKLFCEMGSDGMTIDEKGNLYLTGNGVTIYSKDGRLIKNIPVPEKWSANVCFGGRDKRSLLITATSGLYRIKMNVHGVE